MVNPQTLNKAVTLGQQVGHIFVCTADPQGLPHVAVAGEITMDSAKDQVAVAAWFCPGTVASVQFNRGVSLVVWEVNRDKGYQLLGEIVRVEDTGMLNGYAPEIEKKSILPQVRRRLVVRVTRILIFTQAPHTDQED